MNIMVDQMRAGISAIIAQNPTAITPYRMPLVDNGLGGQTRSGTPTPCPRAIVRISLESAGLPGYAQNPAGVGPTDTLYVLTDHQAPLIEGDTFRAGGKKYVVGKVSLKSVAGQIYGTAAKIMEVEDIV